MNEHDIETQAALYAIGALDGAERAEFEARLAAGDPAYLEALRAHEETLARLAMEDPPVIPPAHVKEQLLERIAASEVTRRRTPARTGVSAGWWRWAAVAVAAGIAGAWLSGGYVAARYEIRLGQMARETAALHVQLRRAETTAEQVAVYKGAVDLMRDPATRVVDLHGQGPASTAVGRVIFNEKSGGHVFVANLPPAPAGKAYELWTISGPAPVAAGVFQTDSDGRGHHAIAADTGPVKVFAITLEPAGGVPAPTGPMVLASK